MRIEKIRLKNFRLHEESEFVFPARFTVLIGDNGKGKTSILDAIAIGIGGFLMGFDGVAVRTIAKSDIRVVTHESNSLEPQLPCEVEASARILGSSKISTWKRAIQRISAKTTATTRDARTAKNQATTIQDAVRSGRINVDLPVFAYHGTGRLWSDHNEGLSVGGSRIEQGYKTALSAKSSPSEFLAWFRDFEYNAQVLRNERELALLSAFKQAIQAMVPEWDEFAYDRLNESLVGVKNMPDGTKSIMPFALMSDGYKNMVGMVADIAYRCIRLNPHLGENAISDAEGVVLIDEIDLHLHPKWQKSVVGDLKRVFPKLQFICTTHSPFIVQSISNEELVDLNGKDMTADYRTKSVEDIAAGEMGVPDVTRSEQFIAWRDAAEEYFEIMESTNGSEEQKALLKAKFDELTELFHGNPVFVAVLQLERQIREGGQ